MEDLLNPTSVSSTEEAESVDSEVDSPITGAGVAEVVEKLHSGRYLWVDGIHPEFLKALDVGGLSWLTRLCNITWTSGTVPLDWQTGLVVPLFTKGDRTVCCEERAESKGKALCLPLDLCSYLYLWSRTVGSD